MTRLRLVVLGAGSWVVASHLPYLAKRRDEVEFWGVCRHGAEQLDQIKDQWGFHVASQDYHDVLGDGADIAVIASPTSCHYDHALAALEAGAHVLVEKPFTLSADQANTLVERAAQLDRHVVVSFGYNYRPSVREARRLIAETGGIGTVEHVLIHMCSATRELLSGEGSYARAAALTQPESETWTDPAISGGGYGQAQLSHALALGRLLAPFRVSAVTAIADPAPGRPVERHVGALLELDGGGIGVLSGASAHAGSMDGRDQLQVRMVGSDGQFQLEMENDQLWLHRAGGITHQIPFEPGSGRYECDGPPNTLVDLALGRPVENLSPGWLGATTVSTLEAYYTSLADGGRRTATVPVPTP